MADPRDELITVTMRGEEWDTVRAYRSINSYATHEAEDAARAKIDEAQAGQLARRNAAAAEVEKIALDATLKRWLRAEVRRLLAAHDAGTLKVDHLGCPYNEMRGWDAALMPHTQGGRPAIHVTCPHVWFEGKQFEIPPEDHAWIVAMVREEAEIPNAHYWNDSGPWVSVIVR